LGLVPLLCFVLLWGVFEKWRRGGSSDDLRAPFIAAAVAWGVLLALMTEILSLFDGFTVGWVLGLWVASSLLALLAYARLPGGLRIRRVWPDVAALPLSSRLLLLAVAAILGLVGLTAAVAPPNTNDALDYHMPRVAHWIQQANVVFYPTDVPRQLNLNPWAEYAIAHFQVLTGGDRWANLVQWFSLLGSTVGVSLVARELGANGRVQVYAAVISATIPMGVLQGATAQNDYVVAFWLVAFVFYVLRLRTSASWGDALGAGGALGLAILTKSTAYLFAFPFLLWFALPAFWSARWARWRLGLAVAALTLVVNLGHYARNYDLYGSPLGPGQEGPPGTTWGKYTNDAFTPAILASNIVRNLALHTGIRGYDAEQTRLVEDLHAYLGADASDPRTTWTGQVFSIRPLWTDEDFAGNHLHLLLGLAALALCLASGRLRRRRPVLLHAACVVGGFLLFALVLKWSPWSTRLYLASFVLFAPIAALALGAIPRRVVAWGTMIVLLVGALPFVFYAARRPLIGNDLYRPTATAGNIFTTARNDQYFATRPQMAESFEGAAQFIREMGCDEVGLLRLDAQEYPLWVLLDGDGRASPRLQAVAPVNTTAALAQQPPFNTFSPCAVAALYYYAGENETVIVNGKVYHLAWTSPEVGVYAAPGVVQGDTGNPVAP
jgi:4-amino-4-deoxy-L-arabinose transferase-like glycosyltransferase